MKQEGVAHRLEPSAPGGGLRAATRVVRIQQVRSRRHHVEAAIRPVLSPDLIRMGIANQNLYNTPKIELAIL